MEKFSFVKPSDDENSTLCVQTIWPLNYTACHLVDFQIKCSDGVTQWEGFADQNEISLMSPPGVDTKSFSSLTFNAFSQNSSNVDSEDIPFITASFGANKESVTLYWKLKQRLGFQVVLGSVKLNKKNSTNGQDSFQELVEKFNRFQKENITLTEANLHLRASLEQLNSEKTLIEEKHKEWEEKVFTRFKDVLNSKKRKIKLLMTMAEHDLKPSPKRNKVHDTGVNHDADTDEQTDADETDIE